MPKEETGVKAPSAHVKVMSSLVFKSSCKKGHEKKKISLNFLSSDNNATAFIPRLNNDNN